MIFRSLTTRVICISIILLAFGISFFAFLNLRKEQAQLINSARENTELLLRTVEASIYNSMRIGNTEDVQVILEMVGQNPKLTSVRIFHPHGMVLRSSHPMEVGKPVDGSDYNLYVHNKKEGVYTVDGLGDLLKMIKPIYNEEPCHACHGHKARVIGVLNVNYSLSETQKRMLEATKLFFISTAAIIAFLSIAISLVLLKFVRKPLNLLVNNMAKVEKGDLTVRMNYIGKDEVGQLATSFDSMVDRLDVAKKELEQFHFQQMERADRLASVGEMAAGIAHEIKNPLTGIAAAISIIKEDFDNSDPRSDILTEVLDQVKRLDKTVNDMLFFGKPSPPEFVYADINAILNKTLVFASQYKGGKHIDKKLQIAEDLPYVYVDPKQMQQVFLNLILNAFQAMPGGGELTLITEKLIEEGNCLVQITIADTGEGIPDQVLEKLFTPFFTTKAQGTGLGLAICHKIVSQHNGTLNVTSECGKGTKFIINLPGVQDMDLQKGPGLPLIKEPQ
ncbi:sensor protein ZraS [Geobacter sp. OR-1]|uniref:sensor histidine kinase n=1 Tax=Geobacter sp. OR-1 TaxID=1266765 RepID=UPI00054419F8|nr:ATP-binding protein [Geobacter sp. OR-1]GAM10519.1 sensor protein ZraS [Geobacter sp. OR-1]